MINRTLIFALSYLVFSLTDPFLNYFFYFLRKLMLPEAMTYDNVVKLGQVISNTCLRSFTDYLSI